MAKKIFLGGLVGGILVFLVSGFLHAATSLGEVGIRNLPGEDTIVAAMRASIHESGFYFFPGLPGGMHEKQTPEQQAAYLEKYKQGPTGILIYSLGGEGLQYGKLLVIQFLIGLIAAFIVAWILAMTAGTTTYLTRVTIALMLGIFAGVFVDLPYWNWYGFPTNYVIGHILGGALSWAIAGLGMAAIVKPSTAA
jgi:hypothetical protein